MNEAAAQAAPVFLDAITQMSFDDARKILNGGPTAATDHFRLTTSHRLTELYAPIVEHHLNRVGAIAALNRVLDRYRKLPLVRPVALAPQQHVTARALYGLFDVLGAVEADIRETRHSAPRCTPDVMRAEAGSGQRQVPGSGLTGCQPRLEPVGRHRGIETHAPDRAADGHILRDNPTPNAIESCDCELADILDELQRTEIPLGLNGDRRSERRWPYRSRVALTVHDVSRSGRRSIVRSRNLSRRSLAFLHPTELPADARCTLCFPTSQAGELYVEATVVRRRLIHPDVWDVGVRFRRPVDVSQCVDIAST